MNPIEDLLVSAWKPGDASGKVGMSLLDTPDEVHDNRYTDTAGWVSIPASPSTEGWVHFVIRDDEGNAHVDSVEVRHGTAAPAAQETKLYLRAEPAVMDAKWDGRDSRSATVASGSYIASMVLEGRRLSARLVKLN